jgi:ubiquinone/menaquinone biosynthesis C-methylase UbiE
VSWLGARLYDAMMARGEGAFMGQWRGELLGDLDGQVLELGAGTGANLGHYPPGVELTLTEPDRHMRARLMARHPSLQVTRCKAEQLPFDSGRFDVVVMTLVLCSVRSPSLALSEVSRVLKPGGRLVFVEHVASRDPGLRAWQERLQPLWSLVAGNCHLAREAVTEISAAGFTTLALQRERMPGAPALVAPTVRGVAVR